MNTEKWGIFELALPGKSDGNPFTDYELRAEFSGCGEKIDTAGFYDGNGTWRVRFMPSCEGEYTYRAYGSAIEGEKTGKFNVTAPGSGNHGPVHVEGYHFRYADGTPYYSVGTTCYAAPHQDDATVKETLDELKKGYFNKFRFTVFPKHYEYNYKDPVTFPYEGTPMDAGKVNAGNFMKYDDCHEPGEWDYTRFNPEHFRRLERFIKKLGDLGIEADIIAMHPYDRWGFSRMTREQDELYWRYILARFSAYRNVWWSLANEYDILKWKDPDIWEFYAELILECDPYGHPRSIHNCIDFYDHTRPWITHCSIQRQDLYRTTEYVNEWRERYGKPIVCDEMAYEGDINNCWGNISGEEMVRRFWEATVRGGYCGHGETYLGHDDKLWWSHGGKLWGTSPERIRFLHGILTGVPGLGLRPLKNGEGYIVNWDDDVAVPESPEYFGEYFLYYYGFFRPGFRHFRLDENARYTYEVIDTWNMTISKPVQVGGHFKVDLPGREYMAIRIKKVNA